MNCPACEMPNPPGAARCEACGERLPEVRVRRRLPPGAEGEDRPDRDASDDSVATVIPYRNGKALAAYYCGVFSLVPVLGLVLGPVALVLGILGLRAVLANPRLKGTAHAVAGIVLGSLTALGNWGVLLLVGAAGVARMVGR